MLSMRISITSAFFMLLFTTCVCADIPPIFRAPLLIHRHPNSVQSVHINNNGWIVWAEGDFRRTDVWLYDGMQVRRLSAGQQWQLNKHPRINNRNQIVWVFDDGSFSDVVLWDNGILNNITQSDGSVGYGAPDINDLGWVVTAGMNLATTASDIYLWKPGEGLVNLTGWAAYDSQNPRINNLGEVAWNAVDPDANPQILFGHVDDIPNALNLTQNTEGDDYSSPDLNELGQVVWMHHNGRNWNVELWSADSGIVALTNNTGTAGSVFPAINNLGWVAYEQYIFARKYDVHLFADGSIIPLTDNTDPTRSFRVSLNDRGELVYVTREDIGGQRYWSVMLVQPVPEPASGLALLSALGMLGIGSRRRWNPFRRAKPSQQL